MKINAVRILAAGLLLSGCSLVQAQSPEPARLLRIFREDIKPGKGAAHERAEMGYVRAFSKTAYPSYVALDAMSGATQAWFLERYESYEALEKAVKLSQAEPLKSALPLLDVQDGEVRSGERSMIATYQKDLSYTPGSPLGPKGRYYTITTMRIRPGHNPDFAEMRKLLNAAYEKAGAKQRRVVYSVSSGAPTGTYLILGAMESLKAMDATATGMSMPDAFGADLVRYNKLMSDIVISSENALFTINPKMSNPSKEFVSADPDFWAPKPKPAAAPKATPSQ